MSVTDFAKKIISHEARQIQYATEWMNPDFIKAVELCKSNRCIVTSGAGKSGFVAQKLASLFGSLGIQAWFVHPGDVSHGDLGRIPCKSIGILFSNSGNTPEIISLARQMKFKGCSIISISGRTESILAKESDIAIKPPKYSVTEAGPSRIIPTSSTTVAMAVADALALTVVEKDFVLTKYKHNHPGGNIGLRLSSVEAVMRTKEDCPMVPIRTPLMDAILKITEAHSGSVIITESNKIVGIVTDGDLRRFYARCQKGLITQTIDTAIVDDCMTSNPHTIDCMKMVNDALRLFKQYAIGDLPVVDSNDTPIGIITLKDLTRVALT